MFSRPVTSLIRQSTRIRTPFLASAFRPRISAQHSSFCPCCNSSSRSFSFSSYGRTVLGETVDSSNITPQGNNSDLNARQEHDYEADDSTFANETDKNQKQSASSYMDPDMNNNSEEISANENEAEYDNNSSDKELNSIPFTEQDSSALEGKMMSSSSSPSRIPSPSESEAIVHSEREFQDVDPLHIDLNSNLDSDSQKLEETTPPSFTGEESNVRSKRMSNDDRTSAGRMNNKNKGKGGKGRGEDNNPDIHSNIPSS